MKKRVSKIIIYLLPTFFIMLPFITNSWTIGADIVPNCKGSSCNMEHFIELVTNVIQAGLAIGLALAAAVLAWAGFLFMTSGSNSNKRKEARDMIIKSVVGLLIALTGYLIVGLIASTLTVDDSYNPLN